MILLNNKGGVYLNYSEIVKKLRLFFKLTQKEFAEKTGLSIATIQGYEQGKYKPKITTMFKIIASFNLELDERLSSMEPDLGTAIAILIGASNGYQKDVSVYKLSTSLQPNDPLKVLLDCYKQLNDKGRIEAVKRLEELTRLNEYTDINLPFERYGSMMTAGDLEEIVQNAAYYNKPRSQPASLKSAGSDAPPLMSNQTPTGTPEDSVPAAEPNNDNSINPDKP